MGSPFAPHEQARIDQTLALAGTKLDTLVALVRTWRNQAGREQALCDLASVVLSTLSPGETSSLLIIAVNQAADREDRP